MMVNSLKAVNYRNIKNIEIKPCENVNIIYGENAQGKTNLLESIWLFTGCRSFRSSNEQEFINFESNFATLELGFFGNERDQNAKIIIEEKRKAELNGICLSSISKLAGEFFAVVFAPTHLSLVKEGPAQRRKFLDIALCQLKPRYANAVMQYNRAIMQRNALLKDITYHSELLDTLDIWDDKLCTLGAVIMAERINYIKMLEPFIEQIYGGISNGKEIMKTSYLTQNEFLAKSEIELKQELLQHFKNARKQDILSGSTSIGPHRDDLNIEINGLLARNFGSQGQQRSCALSLKLAEAEIIKSITGQQPVALLDDVMSELDSTRQDYILNHIEGRQVFITCCEPSSLLKMSGGRSFKLKEGALCT
ncbi:MAG: DNA replication/repair protein RecF, partial [Oscillospiraceae bacterium]